MLSLDSLHGDFTKVSIFFRCLIHKIYASETQSRAIHRLQGRLHVEVFNDMQSILVYLTVNKKNNFTSLSLEFYS